MKRATPIAGVFIEIDDNREHGRCEQVGVKAVPRGRRVSVSIDQTAIDAAVRPATRAAPRFPRLDHRYGLNHSSEWRCSVPRYSVVRFGSIFTSITSGS